MSIFGNIFKRNKLIHPADLSLVGTDMHSHLIPGIDDGSKNVRDSYEMIRRLMDLGYDNFVTSPHVMSDFYRNSSDTILKGADQVRHYFDSKGIDLKLHAAAEYFCDEFFDQLIEKKDILTFGSNYVLFELPFMQAPSNLTTTMFNLQMAGYKPILAHPERYQYWHDQFDQYQSLCDKDIHLQVNINSFAGAYGPQVKKMAERLVDNNMVTFLGTDCHNHNHIDTMEISRRSPALHKLIESGLLLNKTL
jgi:protein-tyrosine phosphatase